MKRPFAGLIRPPHGFTLVEAMIAVAVLMIGVLVLEKNFVAQIMGNNSTKLTTGAVASASSFIETLLTLPLNNAQLLDANGNMQRGLLNNGINCANLDATVNAAGTVVLADHAVNWEEGRDKGYHFFSSGNDLQPHGLFTVFWNVCANPNPDGTRQIRFIVRWRDNNRANNNQQMVMDYVRNNL
jgi:type II secretory pathway pseudopilin PulG